jgi:hypothetical protein
MVQLMWGQYHPIPYQSKIKEKFIGPLSLDQTLWWSAGGLLSYQMSQIIPPIGSDWFYSRLHYGIPLAFCAFLCHSKHRRTGLPFWKYLYLVTRLRLRQRRYLYRKSNVVPGGDR